MALAHDDRRSFLGAIAPPPGYEVVAAIGTTYSVELAALGVTLFTLAGVPQREGELVAYVTPSDMLAALGRLEGRVQVFFEQARMRDDLAVDRRRVTNLLDRFLVARSLEDGAFHPKVWVLRYSAIDRGRGQDVFRLLCASRNLTRGQSWELGACLEGRLEKREHPLGRELAGFVTRVAKGTRLPKALAALLSSLPRVRFTLRGQPHVELLWQFPESVVRSSRATRSRALHRALPSAIDAALLLSPFVEPSFLRFLAKRTRHLDVLTTREALRKLTPQLGDELPHVKLFVVHDIERDETIYSLHAKMLLVETGDARVAFIGSANATASGWGVGRSNCEAVLRLQDFVTIKSFKASFVGKKHAFQPWVGDVDDSMLEGAGPSALDVAHRQLTRASFSGRYSTSTRRLEVRAAGLPSDVSFSICPRALAPGGFTTFEPGTVGVFTLEHADLSTVLLMHMIDKQGAERQVAVTMEIDERLLARRGQAVRRSELTVDDMHAMLIALLDGGAAPVQRRGPPVGGPDQPAGGPTRQARTHQVSAAQPPSR